MRATPAVEASTSEATETSTTVEPAESSAVEVRSHHVGSGLEVLGLCLVSLHG
jgi:hypothetical protein